MVTQWLSQHISAAGHTLRARARQIPWVRGMGIALVNGTHRTVQRIRQRRDFVVMRYGVMPALRFRRDPRLLRFPHSDLVERTRAFWFNNVPGTLEIDGHTTTREDIYRYGGPDPLLTHPVSQRMEWLSRITQTNRYKPHDSPQAEQCRVLCERQGDERWVNYHQNFNFMVGCSPALAAPRCLCILPPYPGEAGGDFYQRFLTPKCDQWMLVLKRRLARSCQVDVVAHPVGIDWSQYDLVFLPHTATNRAFRRPNIPVVLYGHDYWGRQHAYQWVIDWLQPDVLLVPYPTPWRERFRLPAHTRVAFSPFAPSMFFTRPNLDPAQKQFDLLVTGATEQAIYAPRATLDRQIRPLTERYRIEFSHHIGARRYASDGGTLREGPDGVVRYLNQWSVYLGSARYAIFGRMVVEPCAPLLGKYYEYFGSGAIPIVPEVPDLALLGVRPFEHYIPLAEVEGNNERLSYVLDHYEEFFPIAQNAVAWYQQHVDRMLFDDFEVMVHELTGMRFPMRLIW